MLSRWRRTWVKLWVNECLTGTIRFDLTPEERSVWYDLIILAGQCRQPGVLASNEKYPFPHNYIAGILNIPLKLLEQSLEKFKKSDRVVEDENGIKIMNWERYQSEYERQKKYREKDTETKPHKYTGGKYGHMVKK